MIEKFDKVCLWYLLIKLKKLKLPTYVGIFHWKSIGIGSYSYSCKAFDCLLYVSFFTYLLRRDLTHQFCEFQHFLVNFSVKVICFILITQNTPAEENLTECELMLLLFWFGLIAVLAVITQSHVWFWKNSYIYHFLSINSQNAMDGFLFHNKIQLST